VETRGKLCHVHGHTLCSPSLGEKFTSRKRRRYPTKDFRLATAADKSLNVYLAGTCVYRPVCCAYDITIVGPARRAIVAAIKVYILWPNRVGGYLTFIVFKKLHFSLTITARGALTVFLGQLLVPFPLG
jgi:hypothetical protein